MWIPLPERPRRNLKHPDESIRTAAPVHDQLGRQVGRAIPLRLLPEGNREDLEQSQLFVEPVPRPDGFWPAHELRVRPLENAGQEGPATRRRE